MLSFWGTRHTLTFLGFLGIVNVYFCRLNLSMAVVSMVRAANTSSTNSTGVHCYANLGETKANASGNGSSSIGEAEFDWDPGVRGDLLGSYYYGYIWTQIPGGWLASKYGVKKIWGISMLLSGIITLLTPLAAEGGLASLITVRVLVGFFHGVAFPAMHSALSVWAPPVETSKLVACYWAGTGVGTVLVFPISGLLAANFGWRSIFYFTGSLTLAWCVLWAFLAFDNPQSHPRISAKERDHILSSLSSQSGHPAVTPWKAILMSPLVWSVSLAHLASNWGNYQLNSMFPTYLSSVLGFKITANGFISALPFLAQAIMTFFSGWLTDLIRQRNILRTVTIRKINTVVGLIVPGITVVIAGYLGCNAEWAILFFTLSVGINAFTVPGSKTSPLDFAPAHAGVIMGFNNMFANLAGFLAPQTTGHLLSGSNTIERWQLAFWISALVFVPGVVMFLIFGSDQLQPWAQIQEEDAKKKNDNEKDEVTML